MINDEIAKVMRAMDLMLGQCHSILPANAADATTEQLYQSVQMLLVILSCVNEHLAAIVELPPPNESND